MVFTRILQRLIYGDLDPDTLPPDLARRIRHIFTVVLLMIVVSLPFIIRAIQWDIWARVFGIGTGLAIALTLVLGNRQRMHLDRVAHFAIFSLACAVIPAVMTNGGFSGAATAWLCLLPLFGGFLAGYRGAVVWGLFSLLTFLAFLAAESLGYRFPDLTPRHLRPSQRFLLYTGVTVSVYLVVTSFLSSLRISDLRFKGLIEQLEQEVVSRKEAELEARRASETKSQFLANVSHELRTPMNAIIGMTQLALDTSLDEQQQHQMRVIDQSSRFLLGLINDILDFSKIEANKLEITRSAFLFDETMGNLAVSTGFSAREKGLGIYFQIDPRIPPVLVGDELRISQILMNLLSNAVKFTSRGWVSLSAEYQHRSESEPQILFEVTDTGIGMQGEYVKALFTPFSQADTSITRQFGGTGLGLAITKRLTDLMGGRIEVESQPGAGSRFRVVLPLPQSDGVNGTNVYMDRFQALVSRCEGRSVLLMMSDKRQAAVVESLLLSFGMIVETSPTAAESARAFEIAVLDDHYADQAETIRKFSGAAQHIHLTDAFDYRSRRDDRLQLEILPLPVCRAHLLTALARLLQLEEASSYSSAKPSQSRPLEGVRLLLVEDNVVNQEVAKRILDRFGAQTEVANNGQEALQHLEATSFDAILMDVQMPVMDGIEATLRIRANERWRELPILGLSAHVHQSHIDACLRAGMSECIAKPYRKEELLAVLQSLLQAPAPNSIRSN